MIVPSIDIMDGKAVQLRQGKEKVLEREDVLGLAKEFRKYGEIAVIDLDAALGRGDNVELIRKICRIADCRVGGGIRTVGKAEKMLAAGAKKIIIGTKAEPDFLSRLPKDRLIAALDTKEGVIVDKGWTRKTGRDVLTAIDDLKDYCAGFLYTDVDREGLMKGPNMQIIREISKKAKITAAGGITTIDQVSELEDMGVDSQLGMAVYAGKLDLSECFIAQLKGDIIPTIVQDDQVLMLAYSSKESLKRTFETGKATYFSRSRDELWTKGETSGNTQELIGARHDCDRDALLFKVKQKGVACHTGRYSCFGDRDFSLDNLYSVLKDRIDRPTGSYSSRIGRDEEKIKKKIMEEAEEVIGYTDRQNLVWEVADLTYFTMLLMAKKGITIDEIKDELWRRRR